MKIYGILASTVLLSAAFLLTPATAKGSCTIFEHRDYGGAKFTLHDNDRLVMVAGESIGVTTNGHGDSYRILYRAAWNDHVSSFQVTQGCTLTLWEHIDQGGARFRSNRSYKFVGSAWNDEASEALCTCPG